MAEAGSVPWRPSWRLPRQLITLDTGVTLAYVDLPPHAPPDTETERDRSDGAHPPTVVMLHGLTNDADSWADTVETFRAELPHARVLIPDLRGHGQSTLPADGGWRLDPVAAFAMSELAGDVSALLRALGVARATVIGHSMGSLVALHQGLADPELVARLVLVSTTGRARDTPFLSDWLRHDVIEDHWRKALADRGVPWLPDAMSLTPLDADPDAVNWMQTFWNLYPFAPDKPTRELAERAARLPLATWLGATQSILDTDLLADLDRLRAPVGALWATQDSFFRADDQQALIATLAGAAARRADAFVWKQYGRLPLAADGIQTDDLGHNLTWDAPHQLAIDLAACMRAGSPTPAWFRSGVPNEPRSVVVDPQPAPIVTGGRRHGPAGSDSPVLA